MPQISQITQLNFKKKSAKICVICGKNKEASNSKRIKFDSVIDLITNAYEKRHCKLVSGSILPLHEILKQVQDDGLLIDYCHFQ